MFAEALPPEIPFTLPQDEPALLLLAQAGDAAAFEALQRSLVPPVARFVRRLVGEAEADDIVQDVFIAFYKHLGGIDPPEKLRPFVFRIARNRCYDELRRRGRFDPIPMDDEPMTEWVSLASWDGPQPEDVTHWILLQLEVQEAMERLPEAQRQALILYAEEGLNYAEIAEIMNTTTGTVKSRVFYARRTLRRMLRPEVLEILDHELG